LFRAPGLLVTLAVVATATLGWVLHQRTVAATGGAVSYPVDDAFIHMAIARSIAEDGTYGVSPGQVSTAASSLSWPLLLAGVFRLGGLAAWAPFWLNMLAALPLPLVTWRALRALAPPSRGAHHGVWLACSLIGVVWLCPTPTLINLGMEHTLHVLLTLYVLGSFAQRCQQPIDAPKARRQRYFDAAALIALGATRYEGLLFALSCVVGCVVERSGQPTSDLRRWARRAAPWMFFAAVGPALFAGWAIGRGHPALPLSVLMKRHSYDHTGFALVGEWLQEVAARFGRERHLAVLLSLALVVCVWCALEHRRARDAEGPPVPALRGLVISTGTGLVHVAFAGLGWFYRYDAYFIAAIWISLMATLAELTSAPQGQGAPSTPRLARWAAAGLLAVLAAAPLAGRTVGAFDATPRAARNIYHQQVQSARFLTQAFPRERVAVNDIGAVAYYRRVPLVDLAGLSDFAIAKARGQHFDRPMSKEAFAEFTQDVEVAILYEEWFEGLIPEGWIRVARLGIPDNRVCAFPTVSVFAPRREHVARVRAALETFQGLLPPEVEVTFTP
jgi:hypothetical protein